MDVNDPGLKRAQSRFAAALVRLRQGEQAAFLAGEIELDLGEGWRVTAEPDTVNRTVTFTYTRYERRLRTP